MKNLTKNRLTTKKRWGAAALSVPIFFFVVATAAGILTGSAPIPSAWAQQGGGAGEKSLEPKKDVVKEKRESKIKSKKGGSLFVLEDIKIEGKVYKPQAFHVINRKELNLAWDVSDPRFRRSFLTQVVKAVRRGPF
jgi:hypothetical protein